MNRVFALGVFILFSLASVMGQKHDPRAAILWEKLKSVPLMTLPDTITFSDEERAWYQIDYQIDTVLADSFSIEPEYTETVVPVTILKDEQRYLDTAMLQRMFHDFNLNAAKVSGTNDFFNPSNESQFKYYLCEQMNRSRRTRIIIVEKELNSEPLVAAKYLLSLNRKGQVVTCIPVSQIAFQGTYIGLSGSRLPYYTYDSAILSKQFQLFLDQRAYAINRRGGLVMLQPKHLRK